MSMLEAPKTPFKSPTNAISWIIQFSILALCVALGFLIGEGRGWATGTAIGGIAILIEFSWPLRKEVWFWLVVGAFAALDVWGVLALDWSWVPTTPVQRGGYKTMGVILLADVLLMAGTVYGIFRLKYGKPTQAVEESIDDLPSYGDRDMTW